MIDLHTCCLVAIVALVTAAIRFLPFFIFSGNRRTPAMIDRLGKVLPCAIMGMLVVYCLKNVSPTSVSSFFPALISCLVVGVLHVWKRNTLISIVAGTLCYMFFVQIVF